LDAVPEVSHSSLARRQYFSDYLRVAFAAQHAVQGFRFGVGGLLLLEPVSAIALKSSLF